jgi:hypothetical protein
MAALGHEEQLHTPAIGLLIQLTHFNILNAIIDPSDTLHIATFRILEPDPKAYVA